MVRAQQPANRPVIGYLLPGSVEESREVLAAFHRGLATSKAVTSRLNAAGRDLHDDRLSALVADLVQRQVTVIATASQAAALAAHAATRTMPIVFMVGNDPVDLGLVASLDRPGGNATGISLLVIAVTSKRVELLHEMVPTASSIAYFVNPTIRGSGLGARELQSAARVLGLRLLALNVNGPNDIKPAFELLVQQRADALVVPAYPFTFTCMDQIVALAARYGVPAIYPWREYVGAGGLLSYGTDFFGAVRQVGVYTGRILKGDKPTDLPVQQVTKVELVINMKTAKTLGLTLPFNLLARADEVIE
jgi:putative ABC transport system substrate-binding protein